MLLRQGRLVGDFNVVLCRHKSSIVKQMAGWGGSLGGGGLSIFIYIYIYIRNILDKLDFRAWGLKIPMLVPPVAQMTYQQTYVSNVSVQTYFFADLLDTFRSQKRIENCGAMLTKLSQCLQKRKGYIHPQYPSIVTTKVYQDSDQDQDAT